MQSAGRVRHAAAACSELPRFTPKGAAKQRKRHGKAEGLGDFQVVETWL